MVPVVDMLNHKRPPITEWKFDDETDSFVLTASVDISRNDQLFDSYGAKCNSRYLLNYGFTCEDNKGNVDVVLVVVVLLLLSCCC